MTSCRTCGHWGRPPGREPRRFGFCFAPKAKRPVWASTLYPLDDISKILDRSPLMPDTDGAYCDAWKQTKRKTA